MAISKLAPGKKRYFLSLTEATVNRYQSFFTRNNAPKVMLSTMMDEQLSMIVKTLEELEAAQSRKGSSVTTGDLFSVIGKIMTDNEEEQIKLIK